MAKVEIRAVSKAFNKAQAVSDLSLTVGDGEFVALLGPTGAGKTTTLRLIAGLEMPDSGTIRIDGRDVTGDAPADRDVAFVFQQYSLYPHLTVFENMAFALRAPIRRIPEADIRAKVEEVARLLHIETKLQNKATQLSGGQMQRVAIGRALVRSPQSISWTNRCPRSTPSCAAKCALSSSASKPISARPSSMSPTIRPKR